MASQSTFTLEGQFHITLSVEDSALPPTPNLVSVISIHENLVTLIPAMQFIFLDSQRSMVKDLALTEGTRVEIAVGKGDDDAVLRNFRLFGFKQSPSASGPTLAATFIIDSPAYCTESYRGAVKGTSSAVMQRVASDCGLTADVDTTQDAMTWLSFGSSRAVFTQDVALHGYAGSTAMMKGLTSTKRLRYKDMFKLLAAQPSVTLAHDEIYKGDRNIVLVRDVRDVSNSGLMNNWMNYGWQYTRHSLTGKTEVFNTLNATANDSYLPINSKVKSEVNDRSRIEFGRKLDCRNTHQNYLRAYYQNMRGRALFAEKLHVLVEDHTGLEILDTVYYEYTDPHGEKLKSTGKYIVSAKTIYVMNGSRYAEKLELIRPSTPVSGNTPLVGG